MRQARAGRDRIQEQDPLRTAAAGRSQTALPDITRAKTLLGWEPKIDLEDRTEDVARLFQKWDNENGRIADGISFGLSSAHLTAFRLSSPLFACHHERSEGCFRTLAILYDSTSSLAPSTTERKKRALSPEAR